MPVPFPDPAVVALLAGLPGLEDVGGRVSTRLDSTLPAIRVTKVRDREAPASWEATPIYQLEVWAAEELQAGQLAWVIKNNWPTAVKRVIGDALVTGRWVDVDPSPAPDPETDLPRYLVTVGIRISGATP
ncbi:hypothetical protein JNUCC0626_18190 [Lentzea sp. JNUCC 0626]|uniref:hypothetical protein n=1 Tax=Lentzea sp. JNUCC 0626 TaxID=3367513 RepID=UPI00374A8D9B